MSLITRFVSRTSHLASRRSASAWRGQSAPLRPFLSASRPACAPFRTSLARSFSSTPAAQHKFVKESLSDVVNVEKLEKESADRVTAIWLKHHLQKECVSAVVPPDTYKTLKERTAACPILVLPIPVPEGHYRMMLLNCQADADRWYFTSLEEYQKDNEEGEAWAVVCYYRDFEESKNLVLMRGDVFSTEVNTHQVQLMVNFAQMFYTQDHLYEMVKTLNNNPDDFDMDKLLETIQTFSFGGEEMGENAAVDVEVTEDKETDQKK